MKRWILLLMAGLLWVPVLAPAVSAKPVIVKIMVKGEASQFEDVLLCMGPDPVLYDIAIVENGVFHVVAAGIDDMGTPDPDDDELIPPFHLTGTFAGKFVATALEAGFPDVTGRFAVWFGENANRSNANGTFTFSATGRTSDGDQYKERMVAHFGVNAKGELTAEFEKLNCAGN